MEWWIWLLIALGVLLVVGLIVFLIVRSQQKPTYQAVVPQYRTYNPQRIQ